MPLAGSRATSPGSPGSTSRSRAGPRRSPRTPCRRRAPASGTPVGHPRRPRPTRTRTRTSAARGRLALDSQRDHRELRRAQGRARGRRREFTRRPTPRSPRTWWRRAYDEPGDLTEAMRPSWNRLEGAFTLLAVHADARGRGRRAPQPPAGRGPGRRARTSSAPTSRRSSATPARPSSWARTRSRRSPPTRSPDRLRRGAGRGKHYHVDWDAAAAEKGGYPNFMTQGDPGAAARGRRHPARPYRPVRPAGPRRAADLRGGLRTSTRSSSSPAAPPRTPAMVAKYAIEHWTRIPCEVELAHEFRYRDPVIDGRTLVVSITSPARRWTR